MYLKYGKDEVELNIPKNVDAKTLELPNILPLNDPKTEIQKALDNPINLLSLKEFIEPNDKVCIIVNDSTRVANSDFFLPLILDNLNETGVKDENVIIVFANGNHRPMDKDEMVSLVGEDVARRVKMYNHDCEKDEMVYLGETSRGTPVYINKLVYEADKRILTGSVVYHFFAGFGGGRKALVPGVSGHKTIQANHRLMLSDDAKLGRLEKNPVHEDQIEASSMVKNNFLLNVVLNEKKEFLNIYAGDMIKAHSKACEFVKEVYGVKIDKPADIVIASCGGYPKDINIYQAQKTLDNALQGLKEGGQLILLAHCPEGMGSKVFEEWVSKYNSLDETEKALKKHFVLGGHKAYAIYKIADRANVLLVSSIEKENADKLGFTIVETLDNALSKAIEQTSESSPLLYIMPEGSLTVPVLK
ncbi:nickel-dependent lactate racemase [Natranaerofaba carboxydovora]|uniref:nickel-dependent lactate racemase n=1 Tax=Natranaerofaba carboxydovora TaxID=2742683 RepID=UPI001F13ED66|nr:nickel-dependent lactate racemase [Natranaerofaba carboxydovora]UMZ73840.1 hypothetical protein ACONDI_01409 [Natranaerofaba carboxydovora]